jgi:hypothetical protein
MKPTPWTTMVAAAAVTGVAFWVVTDLAASQLSGLLTVPWTVPAALGAMAVVILVAGFPVRQYVKGKRRRVDPLRAATILALGKACTLAGSGLTGAYMAVLIQVLLPAAGRGRAWAAGAAVLAAVAVAAAGRIVEWMCRLPPEDDAAQAAQPGKADPQPT